MNSHGLDDIRAIVDRTTQLLMREDDFLGSYWNATANCFNVNGDVKPGVTTSAFCILPLIRRGPEAGFLTIAEKTTATEPASTRVVRSILGLEWDSQGIGEYNLFTTPIALAGLYALAESSVHRTAIDAVLEE